MEKFSNEKINEIVNLHLNRLRISYPHYNLSNLKIKLRDFMNNISDLNITYDKYKSNVKHHEDLLIEELKFFYRKFSESSAVHKYLEIILHVYQEIISLNKDKILIRLSDERINEIAEEYNKEMELVNI